MKKCLLFLLLFVNTFAFAQVQLTDKAEIRIVTCGPYQGELYSAFGHSAIRVYDPSQAIDLIYNYGVFNFNQPNFYLNFAKGHLKYRLAVSRYQPFVDSYIDENRFVHEQILNLTPAQNQKVFDFLQWNAQEENMHYYYDYFYDNCATRVRDVMKKALGDSVRFDDSHITTNYTIRDLCDIYLQEQPWGDLGIDLCLGLPMDKNATPWMYMFLPDYVEQGFDHAYIKGQRGEKPLVKETVNTFEALPEKAETNWNTPFLYFTALLVLGLLITYQGYNAKRGLYWFDAVIFSIIGLIGWFLFVLWLATDHRAAAQNMNLLWAIPLHFPVALILLKKKKPNWLKPYFTLTALLAFITLIAWPWWPQDLNNSLIPFVLLIMVRAVYIRWSLKRFYE
ncbi:hypothetical protein Oweho_0070 [Owenweeksia hongkongensis DSM 17368]|uniref:Uncharacterized protein n=2 Tax=Owenweeksia TaxID=267986 RepID=G8R5U6_OWEHD|nr:hypothetical protein Oweho_0070 [Owenweeksia hongkongensis DSM 17368]